MKARGSKGIFYVNYGNVCESFLTSLGRKLQRWSALCFWQLFFFPRGSVLSALCADFADAPVSVSLQMDEQFRLSYNFSPEVEFKAVRSLTLGKVTGLYFSSHLSGGL